MKRIKLIIPQPCNDEAYPFCVHGMERAVTKSPSELPACRCGHYHDGDVCDDCSCRIYHRD